MGHVKSVLVSAVIAYGVLALTTRVSFLRGLAGL